MSGLIGSLSSAAQALEAQSYGLNVAGENIANVNTPGYARRSVVLESVPGVGQPPFGGGVDIAGVQAARDARIEQRLRQEQPAEQRAQAIADSLGVVQTAIGQAGASLDSSLTSFFDAFSTLAADPTSPSARQQVLMQGQSVAAAFRDMSSRLGSARADANAGVSQGVSQVNALVNRIASLNASLSKAPSDAESQGLQDQLGDALQQLSQLVDISTVGRPDGGADVSFANGSALVIGASAYAIAATPTAPSGVVSITSQGVDVTSQITAGSIGGLLQVRDQLIPGYQSDLDGIAYTLATQVNAIHSSGYDLAGNAGGNFFTPPGAQAGAAAALAVDPTLAADPSKVAAAGTPSAGDNQTARTLAALRDAGVMPGGATLNDGWGSLVYQVGLDTQTAQTDQQSRAEIVSQVQQLRDQVSGVSLDEEASTIMKFQRAYEANARYFTAVSDTLDTLMQTLAS